MKRIMILFTVLVLSIFVFTGCQGGDDKTITVGATPSPHAEILVVAKDVMAEQGYTLKIREFTDYILPNTALDDGEIDANYFQHQLYLDDFNVKNGTKLVTIASIHYEPMAIYPGKTASIDELKDGAIISVPNDPTNEARALLLLEAAGLIKVDPNAGLQATVRDITDNPKNLTIEEIEAAQVTRTLGDVDMAVVNGNYALLAGLNVENDAQFIEEKDSLAATSYVNVLAVREGNEDNEALKALADALQSEEVKQFIEETYAGSVVPMF